MLYTWHTVTSNLSLSFRSCAQRGLHTTKKNTPCAEDKFWEKSVERLSHMYRRKSTRRNYLLENLTHQLRVLVYNPRLKRRGDPCWLARTHSLSSPRYDHVEGSLLALNMPSTIKTVENILETLKPSPNPTPTTWENSRDVVKQLDY